MNVKKKEMDNGYDVSMFVLTEPDQCIPSEEYDPSQDGEGVFVLITNDILNPEYGEDNSICVYGDWAESVKRTYMELQIKDTSLSQIRKDNVTGIWQRTTDNISVPGNEMHRTDMDTYTRQKGNDYTSLYLSRNHIDGYATCNNVMSNVTPLLDGMDKESYIPAIMIAYHTNVRFNGRQCHGFLPAIGQLIFISRNVFALNDTLEHMGCRTLATDQWTDYKTYEKHQYMNQVLWSSTEIFVDHEKFPATDVLVMSTNIPTLSPKSKQHTIFPLFMI